MKTLIIEKASYTNLDRIYHGTYRLLLFGMTLIKWTVTRKSKPTDWN